MKEATTKLLEKADRSIKTAIRELEAGDAEFYIAEALLFEEGLAFKKHSAVHAAFGKHFAKTGKFDSKYHLWLLQSFEKRITSDYGIDSCSITAEDAGVVIEQAKEFLVKTRQYLSPL